MNALSTLNQIIWYRDHPNEEEQMQLIRLLDDRTKSVSYRDNVNWAKMPRHRFFAWQKKDKSKIHFINTDAKKYNLPLDVSNYINFLKSNPTPDANCPKQSNPTLCWYRDDPESDGLASGIARMQYGGLASDEWITCSRDMFWDVVFKNNNLKLISSATAKKNKHELPKKLSEVVQEHRDFENFCKKTNGFFDINDGNLNKVMMEGLRRSIHEIKSLLIVADPALQKVIKQSHRGGIIFPHKNESNCGWQGEAWKYDITSCYPSIMNSSVLFPLGKAIFSSRTEIDDEELSYCAFIFAEIVDSHFLMPNAQRKPNWYTNVDIRIAQKLGLEVHLSKPESKQSSNYISFSHQAVGSDIFGDYIDTIFPLKQNATDNTDKNFAKLILNKMYGLLAKSKYREKKCIKQTDFDECEIISIIPCASGDGLGDNGLIIEYSQLDELYSNLDICLFAPFITAYARERMVDLMIEHDCISNIKQIHTDGWILDREVHWNNNPDPKALGGIKLEYHGFVTVHHCNNVVNADGIKLNALN